MTQPESLVFVYDGDSGLRAMVFDVLKKAAGREDCALCQITYSPTGKRSMWKACEARLGVAVTELHRDRIPPEWKVGRAELPCVLARVGAEHPVIFLRRDEIASCRGSADALERRIREVLAAHGVAEKVDRQAVTM